MLSIEEELLSNVNYKKIISKFASKNVRKANLQ